MDPAPALEATPEGVRVRVHAQPRARRPGLAGLHGDALKLRIQAPPVDGKANAELAALLGELLDVPPRDVELTRGSTGRAKTFLVRGVTLEEARARLRT